MCDKTVFNFVEKVRCKYGIGKKSEARIRRDYEKLPDTPYGKYAQADFGEKWMSAENGRSTKVYFFAIVLARSRYKFTCFSRRPFGTELAIYAHERAFEYFGGKPEKILYDQDRVLISRENLGDLVLTRKFQTFVREQHFQPVFCHKADPESKGKVENVVKYVKENFLVARVFRDIDSLNREALEWLERTGNGKARTIQCSTGGIITACHAELTGAGRQLGCRRRKGMWSCTTRIRGSSSAGMCSVPGREGPFMTTPTGNRETPE